MISFLDACRATHPLQWTVEFRGATHKEPEWLTIDRPFLVVGRASQSDLCLPHREVSSRHVYLQWLDGRLYMADLGSQTGTYVDGRCRRSGWVDRKATVRVGPYRLRLLQDDQDCNTEARHPRKLTLEILHRSIRSTSFTTSDPVILIGSATLCQVRLLDPSVSEVHCALIQTQEASWVVDLLGREGLSLNGTKIRLGRLTEGDELQVGNSILRLPLPHRRWAEGRTLQDDLVPPLPSSSSALDLSSLLASLSPETAELAESLLIPLAHQFGRMQTQLLEQTQKAERERFDAMVAVQTEQFNILRDELEQLRELRQDVEEMRGDLKAENQFLVGRERSGAHSTSRHRLGSASASAPITPISPEDISSCRPPSPASTQRRRRFLIPSISTIFTIQLPRSNQE